MIIQNNLKKHVTKKNSENPFVQTDNRLHNGIIKLSPSAYLLHMYHLSLNPPYNLNKLGTMKCTGLSNSQITRAYKELEQNKLVKRSRTNINGKYFYNYEVFELPYDKYDLTYSNQDAEEKILDSKYSNEDIENCMNINTNNIKTKSINNKISKHTIKENISFSSSSKIYETKSTTKREQSFLEVMNLIEEDFQDEKLISAFKDFLQNTYDNGKNITAKQYRLRKEMLLKLSNNKEEQIEILRRATVNNWANFYPINQSSNRRKPKKNNYQTQKLTPINKKGENKNE